MAAGLGLCLALTGAPSLAQDTPSDARHFVEKLGERAINELTPEDISDAERVERMRALLADAFDMPTIAKFVLGVYWRRATKEERSEFLELYQTVVAHSYSRLFKDYAGEIFLVNKERPAPGGGIIVYGRISRLSGEPTPVEMLVKKSGNRFKTLDIKVAGVSMPLTHRKEYSSVIRRRNGKVSGLLSALRKKARILEKSIASN
ncbi:MAG: ABC transporter substrate-binding protein [Alphaproteobacteria bacterium]|nr:ABC transporter substrate-binding protein [Alphaproteobacteria bacterium]